jgi:hypothetical protein
MAEHRHPLADSFRAKIDGLRLLTAKLDDPSARTPILPRFRESVIDILREVPRPSPELCRELYAIQGDLLRLFKSQRHEYALVAKINGTLEKARQVVDRPPLGPR